MVAAKKSVPGAKVNPLIADVQYIRERVDALAEQQSSMAASQAESAAILHGLAGNGQPGRVGVLEKRMATIAETQASIQAKLWWLLGVCAALGAVAGAVVRLIH